jgi:hypothetical protein
MRAMLILCAVLAAAAPPLSAQKPLDLVERADRAAAEARHQEAAALYELAVRAQPALAPEVMPRLGRQYLWSDRPREAAVLLERYLAEFDPDDCGVRQHLALALSWAERPGAAATAYQELGRRCPQLTGEALLGEARVLRWSNRLRRAEEVYGTVLERGSPEERRQARLGIALIELEHGRPRAAAKELRTLMDAGERDPAVFTSLAQALADQGLSGEALEVLSGARLEGEGAVRELRSFEHRMLAEQRPRAGLRVRGFRDADGTGSTLADVFAELPSVGGNHSIAMRARRESLTDDLHTLDSDVMEVSTSFVAGPGFRTAIRGAWRNIDPVGHSIAEGELTLTWTPADQRRADLSIARIVVADHVPALINGLTGVLVSAGTDQGITRRTSLSAALDATFWSEGNTRVRVRATPRHRLEGVPMATVEWPTVVQRYSEPFDFAFFDPPWYLESGPALHLYRRTGRTWYLSSYLRGGVHRESGAPVRPLGSAAATVERETRGGWNAGLSASWTNSNLAGSAGFQRTLLSAFVQRRL